MNKRQFLKQSIYLTAGLPLGILGCQTKNTAEQSHSAPAEVSHPSSTVQVPYLDTIGLQLWTVRNQLAADPQATLTAIAELGYQQVELMDTRQAKDLLPICKDLGLAVNSSFMLWTTLTDRWDLVPQEKEKMEFTEVLDQASEAGLSHLVFGYLTPEERQSLDDYKKWADVLNEAALKAKQHNLQMAYHNHNFEFAQLDGGVPFDVLSERLDAELFPFELDVFWAAIAGYDPVELLPRIKDRVKLLHLKDLKADTPVLQDNAGVPEEAFQELGDGILPIKKLAEMGKEYGVDYCFVEQDFSPDPLESIKESIEFLG